MTQDKNAPPHSDALLARYHAAQAALEAEHALGPSAQVRANILAQAAQIATDSVAARAIKQRAKGSIDERIPAANDSQWKIRALATVAIFGLTSLLLLQWDRGTPEEQDAAFSVARPPAVQSAPPTAPASLPPPSPSVAANAPTPISPSTPAELAAPVAPSAQAGAMTTPSDKSTQASPSARSNAKPVAPETVRPSAQRSPATAPFEPAAQATPGTASPPTAKDEAAAESALSGAATGRATSAAAAPGPEAAPVPLAPSAPAMRAAPAAKSPSYGAAQGARRDEAAEPAGRLKKSESAEEAPNAASSDAVTTARRAPANAALFAAIRNTDAAALQQALANGADKNAKSNGTPAITLCVQSGQLRLVQLLAAAGADVNAPDAQGTTPLAHARARGFEAIVNALVGLGAT
jgi:Ankyrin repeats (many copies)